MKTLEEFNAEKEQEYRTRRSRDPVKNGIACPKCGKELFDSEPDIILTSFPPEKDVYCECGFRGYRVA